jgi:uncharacterized protein (TIGR02246 family)
MIGTLIAKRKIPDAFKALNRHDLEEFMDGWAEDATFVYPGDISPSGTWKGKDDIRGWFQRFFEQYPSIHFSINHVAVEKLFDFVGNNTMAVHWDITIENKDGYQAQNSGVTVVRFHGGKVVHAHDFLFNTGQIFRAAWGEEERVTVN